MVYYKEISPDLVEVGDYIAHWGNKLNIIRMKKYRINRIRTINGVVKVTHKDDHNISKEYTLVDHHSTKPDRRIRKFYYRR